MNQKIILAALATAMLCSRASGQDSLSRGSALSIDVGRYFFNPSSYQKLAFSTTSSFDYGMSFNYPVGTQTSLFLRSMYVGFTEDHLITHYSYGVGSAYQYSMESKLQEGLLILGIYYRLPLSRSLSLNVYGGPALCYVDESDALAYTFNEFVAPGAGTGAELEFVRMKSSVSSFVRVEINYEHRGNTILTDYAGASLSLGIRFNFASTQTQPQ